MSEPLDERYFKWLYEKVADPNVNDRTLTYWNVLRVLFTTEFVWLISNDENRVHDGKALRLHFVEEQSVHDADPNWTDLGCSMFEMMLGLAERLAFVADGEPHYWFWTLMSNVGFAHYNDASSFRREEIVEIIDRVIFRFYDRDGKGGFFPLRNADPSWDMRNVEIWQQMNLYVQEQLLM